MKRKDIEKKLHTSLQENTPDTWENIASRVGLATTPQTEPVCELVPAVESGERNPAPRVHARKPWFVACVVGLVMLLASLILFPYLRGLNKSSLAVGGSFFIDINPSIQVTLDKKERVEDILPLNEDARVLLADTDIQSLQGKTPAEVAVYIWQRAYATGYLSPDRQNNALLLSSALSSEEAAQKLYTEIKLRLNEDIKKAGVYCAVLTETRNAGVDLEAQKYQITSGKYQLLQRALALGVEIDEEDFDDISISELNEKIAKKAKKDSEKNEKKEQYQQKLQERIEQAKKKNDAYLKSEDFEDLFEEWLEEVEDDFEERWEDKKQEWKEHQRQEYDDDDDDDDDNDWHENKK